MYNHGYRTLVGSYQERLPTLWLLLGTGNLILIYFYGIFLAIAKGQYLFLYKERQAGFAFYGIRQQGHL